MNGTESSTDYAKLAQALRSTLDGLKRLQLDPSLISTGTYSETIAGGFGDVYKGILMGVPLKEVALKKLRPAGSWNQRLRVAAALARELRVWSDLRHENILPLIGFYIDETTLDCAWIVTIWQSDGNISDYIARNNPNICRRIDLVHDTAAGLAYLHSCLPPICHGDIKGANTLITEAGRAIICDFGLARSMDEVPSGLTTSRVSIGTSRYASPELVMADDPRRTLESDVWAWACLCAEILTGRLPFHDVKKDPAVILAISQRKMPAPLGGDWTPNTIPPFISSLLAKCWSPYTESRPTMEACCAFLTSLGPLVRMFAGNQLAAGLIAPPSDWMIYHDDWNAARNPFLRLKVDIETVACLRGLNGLQIQFSACGRFIVASCGPKVSLYTAQSAELVSSIDHSSDGLSSEMLYEEDEWISAFHLSQDGRQVATGSTQGRVCVWDVETKLGNLVHRDHQGWISSLFLVGSFLLSASCDDETIRAWNLQDNTAEYMVQALGLTWSVAVNVDHRLIAASCGNDVNIWSLEDGRILQSILNTDLARDVAFCPNGGGLLIAGHGGISHRPLDVRNSGGSSRTGPLQKTWSGPKMKAHSVAISSDGLLAASGSLEGASVILWDTQSRESICVLTGELFKYDLSSLMFSPGSTKESGMLAFTSDDRDSCSYTIKMFRYSTSS